MKKFYHSPTIDQVNFNVLDVMSASQEATFDVGNLIPDDFITGGLN